MLLYSVQHWEDLFPSIGISIGHTYGVAKHYANPIL